mgnify:CR=1 FL=1
MDMEFKEEKEEKEEKDDHDEERVLPAVVLRLRSHSPSCTGVMLLHILRQHPGSNAWPHWTMRRKKREGSPT